MSYKPKNREITVDPASAIALGTIRLDGVLAGDAEEPDLANGSVLVRHLSEAVADGITGPPGPPGQDGTDGQDGTSTVPRASATQFGTVQLDSDVALDQFSRTLVVPATRMALTRAEVAQVDAVFLTGAGPDAYSATILPASTLLAPAGGVYQINRPTIFGLPLSQDDLALGEPDTSQEFSSPSRMILVFRQDATGHLAIVSPQPLSADGVDVTIASTPYAVTVMELCWVDVTLGWMVLNCFVNTVHQRPMLQDLYPAASVQALVLGPIVDNSLWEDTLAELAWLSARVRPFIANAEANGYLTAPDTVTAAATGRSPAWTADIRGSAWTPIGAQPGAAGLTDIATFRPSWWSTPSRWRTDWAGTTPPHPFTQEGNNPPGGQTGFTALHELNHVLDGVLTTQLPSGISALDASGHGVSRLSDTADILAFFTTNIASNAAAGGYARTNAQEFYAEVGAATHYYAATGNQDVVDFVCGGHTNGNAWITDIANKYQTY